MAATTLANLFVPQVVGPSVVQKSKTGSAILASGITYRSNLFDGLLAGGGNTLTVPSFAPMRPASSVQRQGIAPAVGNVTQQIQVAPRLQRVIVHGASAISRAVGNDDPIAYITSMVADARLADRAVILTAMFRGLFGAGLAGAFKALRNDLFIEDGDAATSANLISGAALIRAMAKLGELKADVFGGILWCHPDIEAALTIQDQISVLPNSEGKPATKTYKGFTVVSDSRLVRAGTTSGKVYDTYVVKNSVVAVGDKPQAMGEGAIGETAHLVLFGDATINSLTVYDRTDFFMHVNGSKWVGTPAEVAGVVPESPADSDLQTAANWVLSVTDVESVGVIQITTNG
jgi:hypothetical protein